MSNFTLDNCPFFCYIIPMMNDDFRDMMPTSEEFYADAKAEFGEVVEPDSPTYDEVADSYAADAWHDAHEYPDW